MSEYSCGCTNDIVCQDLDKCSIPALINTARMTDDHVTLEKMRREAEGRSINRRVDCEREFKKSMMSSKDRHAKQISELWEHVFILRDKLGIKKGEDLPKRIMSDN
jgi:hypothetical protein